MQAAVHYVEAISGQTPDEYIVIDDVTTTTPVLVQVALTRLS